MLLFGLHCIVGGQLYLCLLVLDDAQKVPEKHGDRDLSYGGNIDRSFLFDFRTEVL